MSFMNSKMAPEKEPRLTIAVMRAKLELMDVQVPKGSKLADYKRLCEEHGLLQPQAPEYVDATKICIVKCSLARALNLDMDGRQVFMGDIEKFVNVISRMLRRTSLAMSYHFTSMVASGRSVPNLYKVQDTYWKKWLKIGIDGTYPDDDSKLSFQDIKEYLGKVKDVDADNETLYAKEYPLGMDQVLNYAAHSLATVVTNNAWVPLFSRLARLTKHKLVAMGVSDVKAFTVMSALRSENPVPDDMDERVKAYIHDIRRRLKTKPKEQLFDDYGKNIDFATMFEFNYWMQQEFIAMEQRRLRLMPIIGVGRHHVRLDTRTLLQFAKRILPQNDLAIVALSLFSKGNDHRNPKLDMFQDVIEVPERKKRDCTLEQWEEHKLLVKQREEEIKTIMETDEYKRRKALHDHYCALEGAVCASLFKDFVKKMRSKQGWIFDCSVATDGVSISLQYSKTVRVLKGPRKKYKKPEKKKDDKEQIVWEDYDRHLPTNMKLLSDDVIVLGLDPGRCNMVTITYLYVDETTKKTESRCWKLKRGAYYAMSGIKTLNSKKRSRYASLIPKWNELGGPTTSLSTAYPEDIKSYIQKYDVLSEDWWSLALKRRESWDNLQRYAGKRSVVDSFFSMVKSQMKEKYPNHRFIIAYGSAVLSMKATGKGEAAVPVHENFKACQRIFKDDAQVQYEFRSTMVDWETAKKKEMVYKTFFYENGVSMERLCHTTAKQAPYVKNEDVDAVCAYGLYAKKKDKRRKGGDRLFVSDQTDKEDKKFRYPEVRGLRFSPEDSMYRDRDQEAALTIGRLRCMSLKGLPTPFPFDRRYKFDKST